MSQGKISSAKAEASPGEVLEGGSPPDASPQGRRDDPLLDSLVVLFNALGSPVTPHALTVGLPIPAQGMTPDLLVRSANRAGFSGRLLKRPLEKISPLALPCLLVLAENRACVLVALEGEHARILLPESGGGAHSVPLSELANSYTGRAFFARTAPLAPIGKPFVEAPRAQHWFWSNLKYFWPLYSEVVLAAALSNFFVLAVPLFIMNVYDRVIPNESVDTLWVLAIGVLTVLVFDVVIRALRNRFVDTAGRGADVLIGSQIFEHVMGTRVTALPASSGALANYLREFETLREFFASASVAALVDLPFVFFFILIIGYLAGPLALIPLVGAIVVILMGFAIQFPLGRIVRTAFSELTRKNAILFEAVGGLETVKTMGAEGRLQRDWERCIYQAAQSGTKVRSLATLAVNFVTFVQNLVTVGTVVMGVYLIAEKELTVGGLIAATILGSRTMGPLAQIATLFTRFQQARAAYKVLNQLMDLPLERPADRRFLHRARLEGAIEFRDVVFRYPRQETPLFNNVNFVIRPGERVGLIGRVGSGKSTVQKLLVNLYETESGVILVDGTDIRQIDPADLRRNIGCVLQDIYLFSGSLRENVALAAPYADDQAVLAAAQLSGLDEFARMHPAGLDLEVGERGMSLSGGQRQTVAIARALLLDPPILILDEPTSSMDNTAESQFRARLGPRLEGKTLLLITHRVSMLALVDRVIVLDQGRVVADGPKELVLQRLAQGGIRTGAATAGVSAS